MRKILYFVVLLFTSCYTVYEYDVNGVCVNRITSGEECSLVESYAKHYRDTTIRDIYAVETLEYDSNRFKTILGDNHHMFVVSDDYLTYKHDSKERTILQDWNSAILQIYFSIHCKRKLGYYYPDEKGPDSTVTITCVDKSIGNFNYKAVCFSTPPKFFRVYLIRGYVYDGLYGPAMDLVRHRMDFPEHNAFYKIYVPVWESSGHEPVNIGITLLYDDPGVNYPERKAYLYKNKEKLLKEYYLPKWFK